MIALPEAAALILQARRRSIPDNFLDAMFPTRNVTWQQVDNVRAALAADSRRARPGLDHAGNVPT
jgi:hypothetical protein